METHEQISSNTSDKKDGIPLPSLIWFLHHHAEDNEDADDGSGDMEPILKKTFFWKESKSDLLLKNKINKIKEGDLINGVNWYHIQ